MGLLVPLELQNSGKASLERLGTGKGDIKGNRDTHAGFPTQVMTMGWVRHKPAVLSPAWGPSASSGSSSLLSPPPQSWPILASLASCCYLLTRIHQNQSRHSQTQCQVSGNPGHRATRRPWPCHHMSYRWLGLSTTPRLRWGLSFAPRSLHRDAAPSWPGGIRLHDTGWTYH